MKIATKKSTQGRSPNGVANDERAKKRPCPEIFLVPVGDIRPAVVNDAVHGVTDPSDPSLDELARGMANRCDICPDGEGVLCLNRSQPPSELGMSQFSPPRSPLRPVESLSTGTRVSGTVASPEEGAATRKDAPLDWLWWARTPSGPTTGSRSLS